MPINPIFFNRLRNPFQPSPEDMQGLQGAPSQDTSVSSQPAQPSMPPQGYQQPNTAMLDQFTKGIQQMPQLSNYQPSTGRRIAALMAGLGTGRPAGMWGGNPVGYVANPQAAIQTSSEAALKPYETQMGAWQQEMKPLGEAATMEQARNREQRTFYEEQQLRDIQRQRADTDVKKAQDLAEYHRSRAESEKEKGDAALIRANAYKKKSELGLGWGTTVDEDSGDLYFYNKANPTEMVESGIRHATPQEKEDFKVEGTKKEILARTAGQKDVELTREADRQKDIETRGKQARETKAEPPGGKTDKDLNPTQQKVAVFNRAQKALAEHPEFAPYIHLAAGNTVVFSPPEWYNPTQHKATFDAAHDAVYGPEKAAPAQSVRKQIPGTNKFAVSTDGGKTWKAE